MEDSILVTVKKMLGIPADYTAFDVDVIVLINSTLMTLRQLGVGPDSFTVTGGRHEAAERGMGMASPGAG